MTIYQPSIPTGLVDLDLDYINIKNNFSQLDTTYGTDHIKYSVVTANGYHKAIHMVPISTTASNPPNNQPINGYTATPGYGQLFDAQINDGIGTPDEALFFLSGGNKLTQLTRNFQPALAQNGYTFLPGGLIFQWGVVQGTHGSNKVFNSGDTSGVTSGVPAFTYTGAGNINFPSVVYAVWTTLFYNPSPGLASTTSGTVAILNSKTPTPTSGLSFPLTGFTWQYTGNSNSYGWFMWFAIGK